MKKPKNDTVIAIWKMVPASLFLLILCGNKIPTGGESMDIEMVLCAEYPKEMLSDFRDMLSEEWCDFYFDAATGRYYLQEAIIDVKTDGYNECWQDSVLTVSSGHNSLFLVRGLRPKNKPVTTISLPKMIVSEDEKLSFGFYGKNYAFSTETVREDESWVLVNVYFSEEVSQNTQLITTVAQFNGTGKLRILWVGDLDCDNAPDFLLDISNSYENVGVELLLSSAAVRNEFVKSVASAGYSTDC